MYIHPRSLLVIPLCLFFIACNQTPQQVHQVLTVAKNNRTELEKVIAHYQKQDEPEKLKAAYFLSAPTVIKEMIGYLTSEHWQPDTVLANYLLTSSAPEAKAFAKKAVQELARELNQKEVRPSQLSVIAYTQAPDSLKKMSISSEGQADTFIAYNQDMTFLRYFFMKDGKIRSFVRFKEGRVFLLF